MRVRGGRGVLVIKGGIAPDGRREPDLELPTLTCAHCNRVVVLDARRQRERGFCRKCYAYVCDGVGCNAECVPMLACVELALKGVF